MSYKTLFTCHALQDITIQNRGRKNREQVMEIA